jgi:uncharacterized protein (TIGR02284 family)
MNNPHLIKRLNDLIEMARHSQYGYERCAEHARNPALGHWLLSRSEHHRCSAQALQRLVRDAGGKQQDERLTALSMHHGWASAKGTMAGYPDVAMLNECERTEKAVLNTCRAAMDSDDLNGEALAVVQRMHDGASANVDAIRKQRVW